MSTLYRGYELNDYLETPWYDRETALFQAIIDMLPENGETLVTTEHVHAKLVAGDGDPDPAVLVDDDGNVIVGSGITTGDALLHAFKATAGSVAASVDPVAVLENSTDGYLDFLVPDASEAGIVVESPTYPADAKLVYDVTTKTWTIVGDASISILSLICAGTHGIVPANNVPIRAGGAGGLLLKNASGNGVVINSDGDLQVDAGEYLRIGTAASIGTASAYGTIPIKDAGGTVYHAIVASSAAT